MWRELGVGLELEFGIATGWILCRHRTWFRCHIAKDLGLPLLFWSVVWSFMVFGQIIVLAFFIIWLPVSLLLYEKYILVLAPTSSEEDSSYTKNVTSFDGGDLDPSWSYIHLRVWWWGSDLEVDQENTNSWRWAYIMDDIWCKFHSIEEEPMLKQIEAFQKDHLWSRHEEMVQLYCKEPNWDHPQCLSSNGSWSWAPKPILEPYLNLTIF